MAVQPHVDSPVQTPNKPVRNLKGNHSVCTCACVQSAYVQYTHSHMPLTSKWEKGLVRRLAKQHFPAMLIGILSHGQECYDNIHLYSPWRPWSYSRLLAQGILLRMKAKEKAPIKKMERSLLGRRTVQYFNMFGDASPHISRPTGVWNRKRLSVILFRGLRDLD